MIELEDVQTCSMDVKARIYESYRDYVYALCRRKIRSHEIAEEVSHDVFCIVFRKLELCHTSVHGLIRKITWRKLFDWQKRHKNRSDSAPYFDGIDETDEPDLDRDYVVDKVRSAVNQLEPMYREALTLYYFAHKSYDEVAQTLNIPLGTVKSRIAKAKAILFDVLDLMLLP